MSTQNMDAALDHIGALNVVAPGHNPAKLTHDQVGIAAGWRLLMSAEIINAPSEHLEIWVGEQWHAGRYSGNVSNNTYRTKLSPAELRKERGLEPVIMAQTTLAEEIAWAQRDGFCGSVNRIAKMVGMNVENAAWEAVERHVADLVKERGVTAEELAATKIDLAETESLELQHGAVIERLNRELSAANEAREKAERERDAFVRVFDRAKDGFDEWDKKEGATKLSADADMWPYARAYRELAWLSGRLLAGEQMTALREHDLALAERAWKQGYAAGNNECEKCDPPWLVSDLCRELTKGEGK